MTALSHDFPALGEAAHGESAAFGPGAATTSMKWAALLDAGAAVCSLAGEEAERGSPEIRSFVAMIRDADGWRRELAEKGIDDLSALMEPGIAALLAVNARGVDTRAAARALWREFVASRNALLTLLPPSGTMGPPRKA